MKWIKASEQLPEIMGRYPVKIGGGKTAAAFDPEKIYNTGTGGSNWDVDNVIEWLDESIHSDNQDGRELLKKVMAHFNLDTTEAPQELYKEIFQHLTK